MLYLVYDYISVSGLLFVDISECKYRERSMEQASHHANTHVCSKTSSRKSHRIHYPIMINAGKVYFVLIIQKQ